MSSRDARLLIKYKRRGAWVRVQDNGLGRDDSQRRHLFEPFNRFARQRATTPGVGLGLAITRQLFSAMNGRLEVESQSDLGSTFSIVMPSVAGIPNEVVTSGEAAVPPPQRAPPG